MKDDETLNTRATILIVDDLEANRETLIALLDQEGYQLLEAADGADALRLAAEQTPDLILLDVMMPGMDGFEVCRRLRADARTAEMPIMLVTALDDQPSRITGIEAGADDFVTKPFNRAELRARVRTITRLNRYARLHHEREKLQQADRRIREQAALIDLDPDAILVLGTEDRVHLWNRGAEQLYGWPAAEALGQRIDELVHTSPSGRLAEAAQATREAGAWRGEITHRTRGGATVIVESRWTLLRGDDPRILIVNRDITQKKLEEEKFLRAQRLESLGALAGGIVHDLNNVLAPILMATDLLRSEAVDSDTAHWVEIINASAQRGAAMVKQILSFVRGSGAGKEAVQLRHLINDLHKMIKDTFPPAVECETRVPGDLWPAMVDPTQVYQVLLNLALNARDAMPRGGRLLIEARNVTVDDAQAGLHADGRPGPHVLVTVADTGEGIPAEHLERIFDPFFTTKAPGKGTGLGLATVRQVVRAHGGFIDVHSDGGEGTRFTIHLPAAVDAVMSAGLEAQTALPRGQDELVLFADDEASVREITKATLEGFGYRVVVAGDGTEAIARYVEHASDVTLLVTDLQMPHMDGLAAIRSIRNLRPSLPAIIVSGSPEHRVAVEQSGLAVQSFLVKPLTAELLLREMDRILHH